MGSPSGGGEEIERDAVRGTDRPEVAVVQSSDAGCPQSFGDRHNRGVGCANREIGVPADEFSHALEISGVHGFELEFPAGQRIEEPGLGVSTPAVDRDLVVEGLRTADRADEIDLRWSRCPFFHRLPESAGGGSP